MARPRRLRRTAADAPAGGAHSACIRPSWCSRCSSRRASASRSRSPRCPAWCSTPGTALRKAAADAARGRGRRADPVRHPGGQGRARVRRPTTRTASSSWRSADLAADLGGATRADGRPVPGRVHRPRALRHPHPGRRGGQRRDPRALRLDRASPRRAAGAQVVAPERHDGRPGRRDPRRAGRRGFRRTSRSAPTRRSTPRRSTGRSGRPPSARRSSATGPPTSRTRRAADEALREVLLDLDEGADIVMVKPALAYLDIISQVARLVRRAGGGLPGQRRVRDGRGGRGQRLDGPGPDHHGVADRHPAGRGRHHPHLLGHGSGHEDYPDGPFPGGQAAPRMAAIGHHRG